MTRALDGGWVWKWRGESLCAVDHETGCRTQELAQYGIGLGGQLRLIQRGGHQFHPAVSRRLIDCERRMAHAKTRMPTLLDVTRRASEPEDKKFTQTFFRTLQIVRRIHGPENVVGRNTTIESSDEPREPLFADKRINFLVVHQG